MTCLCHNTAEKNSPRSGKEEEKKGALLTKKKIDFYLELLLFCPAAPGPAPMEMFLPRPPVGLWLQEAGGRDTLLLLPAPPASKSIHPTTVVDRHKQQRRRLVDLLRHINMLWAKGACRSRALRSKGKTRRARRRTDTALFRILYRRACSQFSMRSKSSVEALLDSQQQRVAPPAIMWQPEALWSAGRQTVARLLPDRIIRSDRGGGEALDGHLHHQHQQQLPRLDAVPRRRWDDLSSAKEWLKTNRRFCWQPTVFCP